MSAFVNILSDQGKGRSYILLYDSNDYATFAATLSEQLSQKTRAVICSCQRISDENWSQGSEDLIALLNEHSFRQVSFVAFGAAAAMAQHIALKSPKFVRSLVLVDASTRAHPSVFQKIVDRIENFLPLGLPLRSSTKGFDSKPFLQRIRCPVLVVLTKRASAYQKEQAQVLENNLSTAWISELPAENASTILSEHVLLFQKVPAKCPQKNVVKVERAS